MFPAQELRRPRPACSSSAKNIFAALDEASWAAVRRVISTDSEAVKGRRCIGQSSISPLDYALQLISDCSAVLDHCDRSGVPDTSMWSPHAASQPLSLRGRLSALAHICVMMLEMPEFEALPKPKPCSLLLALQARLAPLSMALLRKYPELAATRMRQSQKTSLHLLTSSIGSARSAWLEFSCVIANEILESGLVFASDVDVGGRNALHDLCAGLSSSSQPLGLFGLTPRSRSSLQGVTPLVQLLISHGALPCHQDFSGETPIGIAVRSLDYTTLLVVADKIFQDIVEAHSDLRCENSIQSLPPPGASSLHSLPEDVIRLVVTFSSPRDAICGVGASCRSLRRIALSPELWRESLAIASTSAHARDRGSHLSVHSPISST